MENRTLKSICSALMIATLMTACAKVSPAAATDHQDPASVAANAAAPAQQQNTPVAQEKDTPMDDANNLLPDDACTREGHWSFFESFVRWDAVRARHTADTISVRHLSQPDHEVARTPKKDVAFRIALDDYRWVLAGSDQDLDLQPSQDGDVFRVEYTPVELGPDDEVVRKLGAPGAYVFERRNGCWELTQELR